MDPNATELKARIVELEAIVEEFHEKSEKQEQTVLFSVIVDPACHPIVVGNLRAKLDKAYRAAFSSQVGVEGDEG